MSKRNQKTIIAATEEVKEAIEAVTVEPVEAIQPVKEVADGVTVFGEFFPLAIPSIVGDTRKELTGYSKRVSEGGTFTSEEIQACETYSRELLAIAAARKAQIVEMRGEGNSLFEPFAAWAETLCADKNGKLVMTGANVTLETCNSGILQSSMIAVLLELTDGRAGKKAVGFAARNARKAANFELSGESEEISAQGQASVIGQDKGGQMQGLYTRLHTATDRACSTTLNEGANKAAGFEACAALIESQSNFTEISAASFVALIQTAIVGRYAAEANHLAKIAQHVVLKGSRFAGNPA